MGLACYGHVLVDLQAGHHRFELCLRFDQANITIVGIPQMQYTFLRINLDLFFTLDKKLRVLLQQNLLLLADKFKLLEHLSFSHVVYIIFIELSHAFVCIIRW